LALGIGFSSYAFFFASPSADFLPTSLTAPEGADPRFQFGEREFSTSTEISAVRMLDANLTNRVATRYAEEIIKMNGDGTAIKEGGSLSLPTQEKFEGLFDKALEDKFSFVPFVEKDILISKDTSPEARKTYFLLLQALTAPSMKGVQKEMTALNLFFEKQRTEELSLVVAELNKKVGDLLKIGVPSDLKRFHLQALNTFQKKYSVFAAVAEMESDPVKTFIAIEEIPAVAEEMNTIITEIKNKI
jgi:hypothetical protein